ncbi:MAG: hypothetical protein Q7S33_03775 [Nanoarchaeota archaeon]|nr:hypothetical protein [Nanoarchaeota archaeon]
MERFDRIIQDIKDIKIQGANNIAREGINAYLLQPDRNSAEKILKARPTEPMLQNSIKFLLKFKDKKKSAKKLFSYLKNSDEKISKYGSNLIKNDMNVFTHCHSTSVINILKQAKKQKKNFVVYNTETEPLLQGRQTANDLAKAGIKVIHVPDSAVDYSLKKCDLFLFGADAFLKKGVVNKVGTNMYAEISHLHKIPAYSCGMSLKYAKKVKIEFRSAKEIWNKHNKNIEVLNPAFDLVEKKFISGVVSEFGILNYNDFIKKAKQNLKDFS